VQEFIIID